MFDRECPVCRTAEVISGKWTLLIIRDLADSSLRFCELERSLEGISPRTLSLRLRALEEQGIVERRTFPEVPPRVTYQLTDKGKALVPLIEDMRSYGRRWLPEDEREPVGTRGLGPTPKVNSGSEGGRAGSCGYWACPAAHQMELWRVWGPMAPQTLHSAAIAAFPGP